MDEITYCPDCGEPNWGEKQEARHKAECPTAHYQGVVSRYSDGLLVDLLSQKRQHVTDSENQLKIARENLAFFEAEVKRRGLPVEKK